MADCSSEVPFGEGPAPEEGSHRLPFPLLGFSVAGELGLADTDSATGW